LTTKGGGASDLELWPDKNCHYVKTGPNYQQKGSQ
jgi:hypothetical protein